MQLSKVGRGDTMDTTIQAVIGLYDQGLSQKNISKRLGISAQKVGKILINAGVIETEELKLLRAGHSIADIAAITGKTRKAVMSRIPYSKCVYNAQNPTENALKIRKTREKKRRSR